LRITASFGITAIMPGEMDPLAAIARADEALYRAKQDGRNCVRSAAEAEALV
jgi:PleD family two-component response regulator